MCLSLGDLQRFADGCLHAKVLPTFRDQLPLIDVLKSLLATDAKMASMPAKQHNTPISVNARQDFFDLHGGFKHVEAVDANDFQALRRPH